MKIKKYIDKAKSLYPTEPLFLITKLETINENMLNENIVDGYWSIGLIPNKPAEGKPIMVLRVANSINPEGKLGLMTTSEVVSVLPVNNTRNMSVEIVTTKNSKYIIEEI